MDLTKIFLTKKTAQTPADFPTVAQEVTYFQANTGSAVYPVGPNEYITGRDTTSQRLLPLFYNLWVWVKV